MARVQEPAPYWKGTAIVEDDLEEISLDQYKGRYLVFFFYPNDFTFVCPTEIISFSERVQEFWRIKCDVIACSCDSEHCHLAWINTPRTQGGLGKMNIPILSDSTRKIAKDYGVYLEDKGVALRGLFIIDNEGIVRSIMINDIPVGRSVDEVLRLVKAYQFTDVHGDVCPEGWQPGKEAISRSSSLKQYQ